MMPSMSTSSTLRTTFLVLLSLLTLATLSVDCKLAHSKAMNRKLQKVIRHKRVTIVLDGVRQRLTNPQPDALVLINIPEIDHQFKVHNYCVHFLVHPLNASDQ